MKRTNKLFLSVLLIAVLGQHQLVAQSETFEQKQNYTTHAPLAHHQVALEILQASKAWIMAFNKGDAKGYHKDAVMRAQPAGVKHGAEEIANFWQSFIKSGAKQLVYTHVKIEVVNETTAFLSANWQMNVGHGVIYQEKWVKGAQGWKLTYDDFEVLELYEIPKNAQQIDPLASHNEIEQVIKASMDWTNAFNKGNAEGCGDGYTDNATMNAIPFASLHSKKQIYEFWHGLIEKGATNLIYHNPIIEQVSKNTIKLSSDWSMNIGEGKIYQEKWIKMDGQWLLGYDEFEVLKQY